MGAGGAAAGGMQVLGGAANVALQNQIDKAKIKELKEEQSFFEDQEHLSKLSLMQQTDLFQREAKRLTSSQKSAFAAGGVDISGSALSELANAQADMGKELEAIKIQGNAKIREAKMNAERARRSISQIIDTQHSRAFGTMLGASTQATSTFTTIGGGSRKGVESA